MMGCAEGPNVFYTVAGKDSVCAEVAQVLEERLHRASYSVRIFESPEQAERGLRGLHPERLVELRSSQEDSLGYAAGFSQEGVEGAKLAYWKVNVPNTHGPILTPERVAEEIQRIFVGEFGQQIGQGLWPWGVPMELPLSADDPRAEVLVDARSRGLVNLSYIPRDTAEWGELASLVGR